MQAFDYHSITKHPCSYTYRSSRLMRCVCMCSRIVTFNVSARCAIASVKHCAINLNDSAHIYIYICQSLSQSVGIRALGIRSSSSSSSATAAAAAAAASATAEAATSAAAAAAATTTPNYGLHPRQGPWRALDAPSAPQGPSSQGERERERII